MDAPPALECNLHDETGNVFHELLCPVWGEIARKGGQQLWRSSKSAIVENLELSKSMSRLSTKTVLRIAAKDYLKASSLAETTAGTTAGETIAKVSLNPVGITADFIQEGLEMAGFKNEGKLVGIVGNIGSGLVTGFMSGGPIGAALGAVTGAALWSAGEVASQVPGNAH